jgi:hypothetical protein
MGGHRYKVYQASSVEWIWLMVGRATTNSSRFDPPYGRPTGTWYQNNQFAFREHADAAKYHHWTLLGGNPYVVPQDDASDVTSKAHLLVLATLCGWAFGTLLVAHTSIMANGKGKRQLTGQ